MRYDLRTKQSNQRKRSQIQKNPLKLTKHTRPTELWAPCSSFPFRVPSAINKRPPPHAALFFRPSLPFFLSSFSPTKANTPLFLTSL